MTNQKKENKINKIYDFDYTPYKKEISEILNNLNSEEDLTPSKFDRIVSQKIKGFAGVFSKQQLLKAYRGLKEENFPELKAEDSVLEKLKMKPTRTQSGITPVTILTKPFPCPGQCIFCPNDTKMPKSYLASEPGAQRAFRNEFDPYLQTYDRLRAFHNIGHNTEKIEIIILGGTWSFYPENYQVWFIKRCFEAMNDFGNNINNTDKIQYKGLDKKEEEAFHQTGKIVTDNQGKIPYNQLITKINKEISEDQKIAEQSSWEELFKQHKLNVNSETKCIGLVVETRPDHITQTEVLRIRRLGATKIQLGWQSLDDEVLEKNKRGHNVDSIKKAVSLIRSAGFKIHAHWMPNLYGSSPEKDIKDYKKVFENINFKPDELKIYPCSLLDSTELFTYFKKGLWKPYSVEELKKVLLFVISNTPQYCRLTRIIRDIPSDEIFSGNKTTNLREMVEKEADELKLVKNDIRSREIKQTKVDRDDLLLDIIDYETSNTNEKFLQYVTEENKIAGFLRLSFPKNKKHDFIPELDNCAMIREIHVYGVTVNIGKTKEGRAQHSGLGKKLIEKAEEISKENGWEKLSVISAIGTRGYYDKRGFELKDLYQTKDL